MAQLIISGENAYLGLSDFVREREIKKLLLVCGSSFDRLYISEYVFSLPVEIKRFGGFSPNPRYEDICAGLELFQRENCDAILAVGGGSAIDTAKCIKLFSVLDQGKNYLEQELTDSPVPLIAIPTTAGTGSESTRNAVLYYAGNKYSVGNDSSLPDCAILCPELLAGLPIYQKKSTMLDALCQGIESWWSPRATEESIAYARSAVIKVMENYRGYIAGDSAAANEIMLGANLAGRAINLTATTAPHAMSYKLSSLFHIPHGHAVSMALPVVWEYMINHTDKAVNPPRLGAVFGDIASALGCGSAEESVDRFFDLMDELKMSRRVSSTIEELELLTSSVNLQRLKNNPVPLNGEEIHSLYERIAGYDY